MFKLPKIAATKEEAAARMAICKTCPELSNLNLCNQCGCYMPIKTKFRNKSCPLGKWGTMNGEEHETDDRSYASDFE